MNPNFTVLLISTLIFALIIILYIRWRFTWADVLVFVITTGLFSAIMDFISSFVAHNYVYPGKSQLWVFTFIFFGWISVCGSCLFIAEGILTHRGKDIVNEKRLWWQVPLLTGIIAVLLDLFIDPIAVEAGYWVWSVKGTVYYEIPLLNFVGWFVLMLLASLTWILIIRQKQWGFRKKILISFIALIPMILGSGILSLILNSIIRVFGLS